MSAKFIKRFLISTIAFFVLVIGVTVFVDPFYHYHGALPGFKKVLVERNYPLPGSVDHFTYDAVQAGSSVMENNNDSWFNSLFECESMKIAKGSATPRELVDLINRAYESHELRYVFFSIHPSMLASDPEDDNSNEDFFYLYDKNIFNDVKYLLNKDILFEKIPTHLAYSFLLNYDDNESYNWYRTKTFSEESLLSGYYPYDGFIDEKMSDEDKSMIDANVQLLESLVKSHPETCFYFYFSPASMVYWDSMYREGHLPTRFYEISSAVNSLGSYGNSSVSLPCTRADIILNFDNYMDSVHFSPNINYEIAVSLRTGNDIVTAANVDSRLEDFRKLIEEFSHDGILEYYPEAIVN